MTCLNENNADQLLAYFEGALPEADRHALDAHAARCSDCRALLSVHTQLDAYAAPEISPDFDAKLYARIAAEESKLWWHVSNWKLVIPIAAVAAMLAAGVFVSQQTTVDDSDKQASIDTQQLEQALDDVELLMPLTSARL
ncbi:MAG: zf-HC2 domain-containing protein [Acidobacteriota bacterium]